MGDSKRTNVGQVEGEATPSPNRGSNRSVAAKPSSGSGRTTAAPPSTGSGRTTAAPPSSGSARASVAPPASGSGRMAPRPASSQMRPAAPPAPVSASASRRGVSPTVVRKKPPMPMKEMIIAGSVLGAILVIALVVWKIKSGEVNQKKSEENARTEIRERNFKLAEDELPKAITAGTNFVIGKDPITAENEDKLFTSFKNNPKIYNVIYTHQFVDRRKPDETQDQSVAMIKDIDHTRKFIQLQNANTVKEEQDQKINYALATENGLWIPVVMARREIKTKPPDKVNPGGWIMVIVRAESDETFAKAIAKQEPPKSEPETKPADTTKPTDSTKPADTKDKSAPEIKEKPVDKKE